MEHFQENMKLHELYTYDKQYTLYCQAITYELLSFITPPPPYIFFFEGFKMQDQKKVYKNSLIFGKSTMVDEMSIYTVVLSHNNQEKELEWSDPEVMKVSIKNTRHSYINRNKKITSVLIVWFRVHFVSVNVKLKRVLFVYIWFYLKLLLFSLLVLYVDFPFSF